MRTFTFTTAPSNIVFGVGSTAKRGEWLDQFGCRRALVLSTPHQSEQANTIAAGLGSRVAGVFSGATLHTPVDTTEEALGKVAASNADCVVSFGGGSTTGLGKAIAYRADLPQFVLPTTYAGSEVTPILGQTEAGKKTTLRDLKVLPEVVVYDPEQTYGLPVPMSVTSGLTAMAHAVEVHNVFADDVVQPSLPREQALANAPKHNDQTYLVPPVLGD